MKPGEGYSDLVMVAGNAEDVLERSLLMLDGRQHYQRIGAGLGDDGELPEISVYCGDFRSYLMRALKEEPGKPEVDGAWIVHEDGLLEPGTFYLSGDVRGLKKRMRRLEGGTGRISVRAMSLVRGTSGFMLSKKKRVAEYREGNRNREYQPSGVIRCYRGDGSLYKETDLRSGKFRLYEGCSFTEHAARKLPVTLGR